MRKVHKMRKLTKTEFIKTKFDCINFIDSKFNGMHYWFHSYILWSYSMISVLFCLNRSAKRATITSPLISSTVTSRYLNYSLILSTWSWPSEGHFEIRNEDTIVITSNMKLALLETIMRTLKWMVVVNKKED